MAGRVAAVLLPRAQFPRIHLGRLPADFEQSLAGGGGRKGGATHFLNPIANEKPFADLGGFGRFGSSWGQGPYFSSQLSSPKGKSSNAVFTVK